MPDTLVIDAATEACSVALIRAGAVIAADFRLLGRGHAEQLVPMIAALPGRGRAPRIAVARGPGSFTGLRVGLAAARALALAWGAELVGYPTLALIAAQARAQAQAGAAMAGGGRSGEAPDAAARAVCVATTGGHGEWFVQEFDEQGQALGELVSATPAAAAALAQAGLVAGSQAEALVERRGYGQALACWPDARAFPLLPAHLLTGDTTPLYGRAPDARLPAAARGGEVAAR
ncbi:tRNA (adenosine(37)-N6)-threonylcarbamoyltransferase complex dimerization subunit type 1 TsaB [Novosphingobium aerophilum]|uniref:tRNA (adenosine(37)-N6)-threonylcarbamoyltransferase complex dimerization subunit type 1 TsaB n=1 Tax=Novosphingobium aerophilum TaxID=2839843 RepID=UPI002E2BF57E|nr:tRNA (adenosine(37)-N6)-threonylcarbamoyltransferase complex dimerization subunit type 1 TsaB [Novosphingobium aerophilum]